ncbi:MAG: hypothetical protein ABIV21_00505 [Pyrinomonadaceae bacterium]
MKFQKGLLSDVERERQKVGSASSLRPNESVQGTIQKRSIPNTNSAAFNDKDHLFETVREETGSEKNYLKALGMVVAGVIVMVLAVGYLGLPGIGDTVRAPAGLELALRDHFLIKEKRNATDIVFYQCDGYYSARVGVETRNDIPNPLLKVDTYSARAINHGDQWDITASPVALPAHFAACR